MESALEDGPFLRELISGEGADLGALVEPILKDLVGLELDCRGSWTLSQSSLWHCWPAVKRDLVSVTL